MLNLELIKIIRAGGETQQDGTVLIKFKTLFGIYTKISNKLVGLLLRARKHGFVDFEGEVLFQGKNDNTLIKLLK
jgi:hypothetical protein